MSVSDKETSHWALVSRGEIPIFSLPSGCAGRITLPLAWQWGPLLLIHCAEGAEVCNAGIAQAPLVNIWLLKD